MNHKEFARSLKLLRKEKGVSQRLAASQLGVSQALLSHYENAAREPGLAFLTRVCDYYDVSADYLLGRTMIRDGMGAQTTDEYDASGERDNRLRGSAAAMMSKRLLVNGVSMLFDVLGRIGHKGLIAASMRYLSAAYYHVFRTLYSACGKNSVEFFSVPEALYPAAARLEMTQAELQLEATLAGKQWPGLPDEEPPSLPELSYDTLSKEYPLLMPAVLNMLHQVGDRAKK